MRLSTGHLKFRLAIAALFVAVGCDAPDATASEPVCEERSAMNAEEAMELYLAAWNEADSVGRACMLERSLAPDATLIASAAPIEGRSAVAEELAAQVTFLLDGATQRDPDGTIQSRHHEAHAGWVYTQGSGEVIERGEDWLEFNEDGLLSRIHILAGTGTDAPVGDSLLAWQRAWNSRDAASLADELSNATTENIRFTDIVTDTRGRDALGAEIERQQDALNTDLRFGDRVEVFASVGGEPILIRAPAQVITPQGNSISVVDYIRLSGGRIERLAGFPNPAP